MSKLNPQRTMRNFSLDEIDVTPERRAHLAEKGKRLYQKYCGLDGKGICSEAFAEYHLECGEVVVVEDFLVYLNEIVGQIEEPDRLEITRRLINRIEDLLGVKEERAHG
ncbi:MAG: hypothetical protein L0154_16580 [Chloroflexi bacterium]|nr:hypothetical protein [Chloroflexota bacterium]